ncbi:MAG: GPR endopeptidase [Clostridiales bacterium]|nr:GPR endopeptidase [Clostridiales bacterium]
MKNSHSNSRTSDSNGQYPNAPYSPRTDLACESSRAWEHVPGTTYREWEKYGFRIAQLQVLDQEGEQHTGQSRGRYTTVYCPVIRYWEEEQIEQAAAILGALLRDYARRALGAEPGADTKVLIAGLGNRFITADAVGPRTADKISVTSHMAKADFFDSVGCCSISAIHPGVKGQTGIEAAAIVQSTAAATAADIVIAIDALAARSTTRLAATIQITDTGIRPGSGIGSRLQGISRDTIGCPVIAIGVPTVVNSATLIYDALEKAGETRTSKQLQDVLQEGENFFVSPRDSDVIVEEVASLLSKGINKAFFAHWA